MDLKKFLIAALVGAGVGAFGYVVGGVAAPFVPGVSAVAYAAVGFLLGAGVILLEE